MIDLFKDGFLVVDNFLPEEKCEYLRNFALNPPGNYHDHYKGYKAINFDNGNNEYSIKNLVYADIMPKLDFLEKIVYDRSWFFVYDNESSGVPAHADPSFINLNLWVTSNDCINDYTKNGLKIYHKIVGDKVSWEDYNKNQNFIQEQIKNCESTIIPYNYNRAVIFLGKLFHRTMGVSMKSGYNNRRISYTFLFNKQNGFS